MLINNRNGDIYSAIQMQRKRLPVFSSFLFCFYVYFFLISTCFRYHSAECNWNDANGWCQRLTPAGFSTARLASVHSQDEQDFLYNYWVYSRDPIPEDVSGPLYVYDCGKAYIFFSRGGGGWENITLLWGSKGRGFPLFGNFLQVKWLRRKMVLYQLTFVSLIGIIIWKKFNANN